ncbi:hypothetical protein FO519_007457 [Halicephalobus sp. NKZ332]|nr:hypothetical protein FO519_007457 [Halicephalobus sp. NKZ332]
MKTVLVVLILFLDIVWGCIRTAPGSDAGIGACGKIKVAQGNNMNSITPKLSTPTVGADGLIHATVKCNAKQFPNKNAYIEIQDEIFGPKPTVTVTLTCINGVWTIGRKQGTSSQGSSNQGSGVGEIYCGLANKDGSCSPDQLTFQNGATYKTSARRARQAAMTLTVACSASEGSAITLQLDNVDTTVVEAGEATAQLYCKDGIWETSDEVPINKVACVATQSDDPCRSCTASGLSYTNGATSRNPEVDSNGCSTITVVCPADADKSITLQLDEIDQTTVKGGEATTSLVCNNNGDWTSDGKSVSSVDCVERNVGILPVTILPGCDVCSAEQITLTVGDSPNSITPVLSTPTDGIDNCLQATATCDISGTPGAITVMTFQNGMAGPDPDGAATVDAQLTCSDQGTWTFNGNDITDISCSLTMPSCTTCTAGSITLTAGDNTNSITPILGTPTQTAGCLTVTATCDATAIPGATTIMMFQNGIAGPNPDGATTVAGDLTCSAAGAWTFNGNDITDISCSLTMPSCTTCTAGSITLTAGDNTNSITPILGTPTQTAGCLTVTATCDASAIPGATTIMMVGSQIKKQ